MRLFLEDPLHSLMLKRRCIFPPFPFFSPIIFHCIIIIIIMYLVLQDVGIFYFFTGKPVDIHVLYLSRLNAVASRGMSTNLKPSTASYCGHFFTFCFLLLRESLKCFFTWNNHLVLLTIFYDYLIHTKILSAVFQIRVQRRFIQGKSTLEGTLIVSNYSSKLPTKSE